MKNRTLSIIAVILCLLVTASVFTACNKNKDDGETTTLAPDESWAPGSEPYQPVEITDVELVDLVKEALGDEASDFNGDISSLDKDQISKVKQAAAVKGYAIKEENGKVSFQKDNAEVTEVESSKYNRIMSKAGVTDVSQTVNASQYAVISKEAESQGAQAVTNEKGNVTIVSRVGRQQATRNSSASRNANSPDDVTSAGTTASGQQSTQSGDENKFTPSPTTRNIANGGKETTAYSFTSGGGTLYVNTKAIENDSASAYGGAEYNSIFKKTAMNEDGEVFSVGSTFSNAKKNAQDYSSALIAGFTEKGKLDWSYVIDGGKPTSFEDIAILKDGSIIAVGDTASSTIVSDAEFKCKNTIEGLICKYSQNGKREWIKLFGGGGGDIIYAVAATDDGGFLIGGKSDSSDFDLKGVAENKIKAFIAKYTADGDLSWVKALSSTKHCAVYDLAVAPDGMIYAAIGTVARDGDFKDLDGAKNDRSYYVIAKFAPNGNVEWLKDFYESGAVVFQNICVADDGGVVVAGHYACSKNSTNTGSFKNVYNGGQPGTYDGMVIKLNPNGQIGWQTPLLGFQNDYVTGITPVRGGYAISGYTSSTNRDYAFEGKGEFDAYVYFFSYGGKAQSAKSVGGTNSDRALGIAGNGQTVTICGTTSSKDFDFEEISGKGDGDNTLAYNYKFRLIQE